MSQKTPENFGYLATSQHLKEILAPEAVIIKYR